MRNVRRARGVAAIAAAAVLLPAVGATADSADTEVTFEVTGTSTDLSISTAADSATLAVDGGVAAGQLPATTIVDSRSATELTWSVQVAATDFALDEEVKVAAGAGHVYLEAAEVVAANASATYMEILAAEAEPGLNDLGSPYTLMTGTRLLSLLGTGSISYTPSMKVTIPEGQLGGSYRGTVTQTVSGS